MAHIYRSASRNDISAMADSGSVPVTDGDAPTPQHDATVVAPAATNGTTNGSVDVEMKEETPADATPLAEPPATTAGASLPTATAAVDTPGNATPPIASTSTPPPTAAPAGAASASNNNNMARTGSPRPPGGTTPNAQQQQQQQQRQELPTQPNPHGSQTRVYLNQNVTPHLLEGMKKLALLEPEKPLKWLSDFLAEKSREYERD
ncbi:hypothetical protein SLS57_003951 [Botryosphaeria dothidea]